MEGRPTEGLIPRRCTIGALTVLVPLNEPRAGCEGGQAGDPGSSVSGDVGLDESCPASLKTPSYSDEVRLAEERGEDGPDDESMER